MVKVVDEAETQPDETSESPDPDLGREVMVVSGKDVGQIDDILGARGEVEGEIDWSPLEAEKIITQLNLLAKNLSKFKKLELHRNPGKTDYFCWRAAPRKGAVFAYLNSKSARIGIGKEIYKVKEDGFYQKDERIAVKAIVSEARRFIKDKGW